MNIPFSANTWYFGQVVFPQPNAGEIYVWPAGQARPAAPNARVDDIVMSNPGLNFWDWGDNGANLHHVYVGQATMTQKDIQSGTTGYGLQAVGFSNDGGTSYGCPTQSGWTYCVAATGQTSLTLSGGDGTKTVTVKYVDNAGKVTTQASTNVILDTTAPTVNITSPVSGREVRGWATVSGNASDATTGVHTVDLLVDGVQKATETGAASPAFGWDTTTVPSGWHQLTMRATDFAGNVTTSAAVAVAVSNGGQMPDVTFAKRTLPDGATSVGVDTANGDAIVEHTDLDVPGLGPELALTRTYNNQMPVDGLFGYGWTSDFDEHVLVNGDNSVSYFDASGGVHLFVANGSGGYTTPPGSSRRW